MSISSFCVSIFSSFFLLLWLFAATTGIDKTILGSIIIIQVFFSIIATGLGIYPLFSTSQKRGLAIAGVIIGSASLVFTIGLLGIGLMVK